MKICFHRRDTNSPPRGELSEPCVLFVTFVVRHLFTLVAALLPYFAMIVLAKLRTFAATGRTA